MGPFFVLWKVLVLGVILVSAKPTKKSDALIPLLTKTLKSFSQESCKKDPLLTQEVDGDESIYRPVVEDQILYTTKHDDSKADVVIFTENEDRMHFKKMKRIYIGLKRFEETKKDGENLYHATFAIVRDAVRADKHNNMSAVRVEGKDRIIEWSLYSDHVAPGRKQIALKALLCTSSFIVPCYFNASSINTSVAAFVPYRPKLLDLSEIEKLESTDFIVPEGIDQYNNLDLYDDLTERNARGGRDVSGGLVGGIFTSVGSLACGIVGIILGPCDDGRPNPDDEVTIIHRYGPPGMGTVPAPYAELPDIAPVQGAGNYFDATAGAINGVVSTVGNVVGGVAQGIGAVVAPIGTGLSKVTTPIGDQIGYALTPVGNILDPIADAIHPPTLGVYKRQAEDDAEPQKDKVITMVIENFPGWKTQFRLPVPGVTNQDKKEGVFFYGFGNCPYSPVHVDDLQKAKTNQEVIQFYIKLIRADCSFFAEPHILKLIDSGRITLKEKTFQLKENPLLKQPKLNMREALELRSSFDLHVLSNQFVAQMNGKVEAPTCSLDTSNSIKFVVNFGLSMLQTIRTHTRHHVVFLTRTLMLNMNSIMEKLCMDAVVLQKCGKPCTQDLATNLLDRKYIMAFIQFIKRGLEAFEKSGGGAVKLFNEFCVVNKDLIEKFTLAYT